MGRRRIFKKGIWFTFKILSKYWGAKEFYYVARKPCKLRFNVTLKNKNIL